MLSLKAPSLDITFDSILGMLRSFANVPIEVSERVNPVGVVETGIDTEDLTNRCRGCTLQKYQSRKNNGR